MEMDAAAATTTTQGEKRPRSPSSVDDVCDFLADVLSGETLAEAVQIVKNEEIDGEAMLLLQEKDIQEVLGITKFGPKRSVAHLHYACDPFTSTHTATVFP